MIGSPADSTTHDRMLGQAGTLAMDIAIAHRGSLLGGPNIRWFNRPTQKDNALWKKYLDEF